ncbi:multicopper oxidase domain-containing protein [Natronobacterium texcoconense]|uniref:Spore coat protein A n=1 Tax=Natronobacterium texcoconense TaxID=1095778 RepID=A0A1H1HJU5_NATTX|nr:multicopper oxidase domain-containing protein [Natronobacterium texcoconense]SDR25659.1 spore coat protein A [Natronobacterium texcoconense]
MPERTKRSGKSVSRRQLLLASGVASVSALAGCTTDENPSNTHETPSETEAKPATVASHSSPDLEKWIDEVPRPGVVEPTGTKNGQPYYEIEMQEFEQELHSDLSPTTVWGYEGHTPGPTIEAEQGEPIYVRWKNDLPDEHLLPVDTTVHPEMIPYDIDGVRTVTHLHGGNIESESDGKAMGWFTRDFEKTGPVFEKKDYYYVNDQPPATLWYHDHAIGITRLNVYAGLAGFYLLRSDHERQLDLPDGEYDVPLAIQDRSLNEDGSLFYPSAVSEERGRGHDSHPDPSIVPEFYGDVPVVNGKAWPRLSVEPRKYRFRLLNGSNSRYYNLELVEYDEESSEVGDDGPSFVQVGNDGGLLSEPVEFDDRLEIGPGKRADIVVDFSDYAGETLLLHNDAPTPYRGTRTDDHMKPLPEIMLVDVEGTNEDADTDPTQLPDELTTVPEIPVESVDTHRHLTLAMDTDEHGRMKHRLGTKDQPEGYNLEDPVTEEPTLGETEIWSIANNTSMSHPMHLHLVHFQVLGREPLSDYDSSEDGVDPSELESPEPYDLGWNDVVSVDPGEVVHIVVHFGEYEGVFNDQTGEYMWHCHMVEHEDYDMMRPYRVLPADGSDGDEQAVPDDGTEEHSETEPDDE